MLMERLCLEQAVEEPKSIPGQGQAASRQRFVEVSDFQPLKVLTWNISGNTKSSRAPKSFSVEDKMATVQLEITERWQPDVLALQECATAESLPLLRAKYVFVGSQPVEDEKRSCGFVHLYVHKGLAAERLTLDAFAPAVVARVRVSPALSFDVAAVHLMPGISGQKERLKQLQACIAPMRPECRLVLGDMNAYPDDGAELLAVGKFREARYAGKSFFLPRRDTRAALRQCPRRGLWPTSLIAFYIMVRWVRQLSWLAGQGYSARVCSFRCLIIMAYWGSWIVIPVTRVELKPVRFERIDAVHLLLCATRRRVWRQRRCGICPEMHGRIRLHSNRKPTPTR